MTSDVICCFSISFPSTQLVIKFNFEEIQARVGVHKLYFSLHFTKNVFVTSLLLFLIVSLLLFWFPELKRKIVTHNVCLLLFHIHISALLSFISWHETIMLISFWNLFNILVILQFEPFQKNTCFMVKILCHTF
jgi:hypothetical protein